MAARASARRRPEREAVRRGLEALGRRGPDGSGIHAASDGSVILGHTRLAIVDVENGAQPIANEDRSVHLVFNGEIYGHAALRAELEAPRGHRFRTRCDAEIALHLYEELGPRAMLEKLRGEFAFVIWDEKRRRIFAARDRFGIKPLLYAEVDGILHLASQAKALFAAGIPSRWNERSLLHAMSMQYTPPDATLFDRIRVLPPGHFLVFDLNGKREQDRDLEIEPYWDLDYPTSPTSISMADASSALRVALDEAVRVRLVADVPVAFQLSGGIDSSAVLALAARAMKEAGQTPPHAFTVAFDEALAESAYNERTIAEEMAAYAGAELHVVSANRELLLHELPNAVIDGEGLAVNAHIAAKRILARAVRDAGFKVVLTGEGADEVLAGYAHLRCDLDGSRSTELALSNPVSAGLMMPTDTDGRRDGDVLDTRGVEAALGFVPTWLRAKAGLGGQLHALLTPDARAQAIDLAAYTTLAHRSKHALEGRGRVEQSLYLWSKLALEGYILRTLGDGMEMAFSIEGRLPFLDHRLFELIRTFPTDVKIHQGVEKAVLRAAVGPLVTERLRTRPKHPFLAPPLFASSRPALLFDVLGAGGALPACFDREKVRALLDRLHKGNDDIASSARLEPVLMMLLSTAILGRHYRL